MIKITAAKTLVRETAVLDRTTPIVVELHPRNLTIRLKGRSTEDLDSHVMPYDVLLDFARKRTHRQISATAAAAVKKGFR